MKTTGLELKLRRVAADVKSRDIAAVMGVHPSRITYIERSRVVADGTVERYVAALATCTTVTTQDVA